MCVFLLWFLSSSRSWSLLSEAPVQGGSFPHSDMPRILLTLSSPVCFSGPQSPRLTWVYLYKPTLEGRVTPLGLQTFSSSSGAGPACVQCIGKHPHMFSSYPPFVPLEWGTFMCTATCMSFVFSIFLCLHKIPHWPSWTLILTRYVLGVEKVSLQMYVKNLASLRGEVL